jgi:hypothetical protein
MVATGERHGLCELVLAVQRQHVDDLLAFSTLGQWQDRGKVTAWERHGMCKSVLRVRLFTVSLNLCTDQRNTLHVSGFILDHLQGHVYKFKCAGYGVSARALTPYPAGLNYCRSCTPASEDGLKESPKHVRQK